MFAKQKCLIAKKKKIKTLNFILSHPNRIIGIIVKRHKISNEKLSQKSLKLQCIKSLKAAVTCKTNWNT